MDKDLDERDRRELARMDEELKIQRLRVHDLGDVIQEVTAHASQIPIISKTVQDIADRVSRGTAEVSTKLDVANQQFNAHIVEDAKSFTEAKLTAAQIREKMDESDVLRKEDSERRIRTEAQKATLENDKLVAIARLEKERMEREQKREEQEETRRLWRWGLIITGAIAFAVAWYTNYLESKNARTMLEQIRSEQQIKKTP